MESEVRYWKPKSRSTKGRECPPAYSVPVGDNGDINRSHVAWVVYRWREIAKANHLYCTLHEGFMCHCIDAVIAYRGSFGLTDNKVKEHDDDGA